MKNRLAFGTAAFVVLMGAAMAAGAADIYKYRLADGGILYSQKRTGSGKLLAVINVPPPTPQQIAARRAAEHRLQQQIARADRLSEQRAARLAQRKIDISIGPQALAQSCLSLPYLRTPLPGERLGTAGGGSRLNDAYWNRMRLLGLPDEGAPAQPDLAHPPLPFAR